MSTLNLIERKRLEKILEMGNGYVLDFSNRSFAEFFKTDFGIDIYDNKYEFNGNSKAKRMRAFWEIESDGLVGKVLFAIFSNWDIYASSANGSIVSDQIWEIVYRLNPNLKKKAVLAKKEESITEDEISSLQKLFDCISGYSPQERGFALEKFLYAMFKAYKMDPRASFRIVGEQIDGSFDHNDSIYLLEAKWTNTPIGENDLLVLSGKIIGKSTWTRGLFLSINGFSDEGLIAFSKGKATNMIGMTGQDLHLILKGEVDLPTAIKLKARKASEEGEFYTSVFALTH
jgi:hypothetical protein